MFPFPREILEHVYYARKTPAERSLASPGSSYRVMCICLHLA